MGFEGSSGCCGVVGGPFRGLGFRGLGFRVYRVYIGYLRLLGCLAV